MNNGSNAPLLLPSLIELEQFSQVQMYPWLFALITSIGKPYLDHSLRGFTIYHSAINLFSSSRQIKKTTRDGTEEIWLEKTYYTTEEAFPTVLRRSEVIGLEVVEMSPLEIALTEVEQKTKELMALNFKYQALAKTSQLVSTNALAMSLNSAVDAPMNTGIASYRQVFFSPDYVARHPERSTLVDKLRSAIDEQVRFDHFMYAH